MKDSAPDNDFDVRSVLEAIRGGQSVTFDGLDVVVSWVHGKRLLFAVDIENDPVQRNFRLGQFYEARELEYLKQRFPLGGVFVDIGANIGNHSLFVAAFLSPSRVITFEPNPPALRLLLANVLLNGFERTFELGHLGLGLSDDAVGGYGMEVRERNIGAAKMLAGTGSLEVQPGDALLADETPSLIKIDVEGMEMRVLAGLEETVSRTRPIILAEIDEANDSAFRDWVDEHDYVIDAVFKRYRTNTNYAVVAKEHSR